MCSTHQRQGKTAQALQHWHVQTSSAFACHHVGRAYHGNWLCLQTAPPNACQQCCMGRCRGQTSQQRTPHIANTAAGTAFGPNRGPYQALTHLHGCNIHNLEALQVDGAIIIHVAPQLVQDGQHSNIGLPCSRGGAQQDVVCSKQGSVANLQGSRSAVRRNIGLNRHVDCPANSIASLEQHKVAQPMWQSVCCAL